MPSVLEDQDPAQVDGPANEAGDEAAANLEDQLVEDLAGFTADPLGFVLYAFPWGEGELKEHPGPDEWQAKVLADVRDGLKTVDAAIREAVSSGHGPGKSALVAWLILWAMSTHEDTRGVVTANTQTQLLTKTWAELAKWHRLFIASHWFTLTATAIYSSDPKHEKSWRIDAIPWSENKSEAFAGLHNQGKRILVIFDEASAISDKIWEVTEGALTDEKTEIIWCAFGNPTRNNGRFHACFHKLRHLWKTWQVDSRTCRMTNKKQLQEWVDTYGEDSDFVRVRVRGEFPRASDRQFIPGNYVEQARGKHLQEKQYDFAAKVIGVDPAWSGDDEIAIVIRQGNAARLLATYRNIQDDNVLAGYIANFEDQEKADAVFVDFGYGTGVVSAGKQMGRRWILVPFGGASSKPGYLNKRAEMWGDMRDWLKDGGAIPNDPTLCEELTGPEYEIVPTGANAGKIVLESKDDMKKRGLASPNRADALALTFAFPVKPRGGRRPGGLAKRLEMARTEYDVLKL